MPTLCSNASDPDYSQANFKLFGVTLNLAHGCDDHNAALSLSSSSSSSCLKSFSAGNLGLITPSSSSSSSISQLHHHSDPPEEAGRVVEEEDVEEEEEEEEEEDADAGHGLLVPVYHHHQGYISDALLVQGSSTSLRDRKKGVPWSEDEHRMFLIGLEKLGKGDWRGISRNFVITRTPTQVASHAQKYFLRQSNLNKKKRRSSLFDIISSPSPHMDHCHRRDFDLRTSVNHARDLLIPHHHKDLSLIKATDKNATSTSSSLLTRQPSKTLSHAHPFLFTGLGAKTALERRQILASSSLSSSPSSSTSSMGRIDEVVELSSLNLSIGPPSRPSYVPLFGN